MKLLNPFHMQLHLLMSHIIRMIKLPGLVLLVFLIPLVTQSQKRADADLQIIDIQMKPENLAKLSDTMTVKFNLMRPGGTEDADRLLELSPGDSMRVSVKEFLGRKEEKIKPVFIPGSLKKLRDHGKLRSEIPEDYYISLLIDKGGSISQEDMDKIKSAIYELAGMVKTGNLFYSWFDEDISESRVVTQTNIDDLDFYVSNTSNSSMYNAIFTKMMEFDSTKDVPNLQYEPVYRRNRAVEMAPAGNKFLVIITDGRNDVQENPKYHNTLFRIIREPELINTAELYRNKLFIYAISFGGELLDEAFLDMITTASGNRYGNILTSPDNILEDFNSLGRKIAEEKWDYEIRLRYENPKKYRGETRTLHLEINSYKPDLFVAYGQATYGEGYGNSLYPMTIGEPKRSVMVMLGGLVAGIIIFLLVMFIIQLIIPLIKNKIFVIKYVKRYKPREHELFKECQYCGDPLNPGDRVVVKCKHVVHHLCWKDYGHICPEYGQNCNDGQENFFDITDPFSKKNKIYYLSWVLYGMLGGFLSWLLYVALIKWEQVFVFSIWLTEWIRPAITESNLGAFKFKIAPFLIIGTLMGFFLTAFFSSVEEYRHKNLAIYGKILLRSILGGIAGFVAFLIGSIILILINRPSTLYFDWIPWIFFGAAIGLIMSIKTTIVWKHGLIGGLISIIFCFIVIYAFIGELEENAILVGIMIYAAGLGISIATIRLQSEHFFLKILQGKKNQDIIPVHKWMSSSGGHNEVYLGRSFACEIQMNWEKNNEEIAQKHAKMYINSRGLPVITNLEIGKMTNFNDRFDMDTGKEYELYNGVRFKIGQTVFQYIETD